MLNIGQRYTAYFFLEPAVAILPEVMVQGAANPQANRGRTGPAQLISDSALHQLPNLNREVVDLRLMSPQASRAPFGDIGIGGQNPRYTTYLVDGGQNTDLYYWGPVARFGLQRSISPEAVAEVQVLAAPADVRNGDFAGGAINIVTRSGTNEWHGSAFGFFQNDALVGTAAADAPPPGNFSIPQFGVTLSGPIVQEPAAVLPERGPAARIAPDDGPFVTDPPEAPTDSDRHSVPRVSPASTVSSPIPTASRPAGRAGVTPANPRAICSSSSVPRLGANNQLELSDHYARTTAQSGPGRESGYYGLGSMASENTVTENALRLTWRGLFGRAWSNDMSLGYLWTQKEDPSVNRARMIDVWADSGYHRTPARGMPAVTGL